MRALVSNIHGVCPSAVRSVTTLLGTLLLVALVTVSGSTAARADEPVMPDMGMDQLSIETFTVIFTEQEPGKWQYVFSGRVGGSPDLLGRVVEIYGGPFDADVVADETGDFWIVLNYEGNDPVVGVDVFAAVVEDGLPITDFAVVML